MSNMKDVFVYYEIFREKNISHGNKKIQQTAQPKSLSAHMTVEVTLKHLFQLLLVLKTFQPS